MSFHISFLCVRMKRTRRTSKPEPVHTTLIGSQCLSRVILLETQSQSGTERERVLSFHSFVHRRSHAFWFYLHANDFACVRFVQFYSGWEFVAATDDVDVVARQMWTKEMTSRISAYKSHINLAFISVIVGSPKMIKQREQQQQHQQRKLLTLENTDEYIWMSGTFRFNFWLATASCVDEFLLHQLTVRDDKFDSVLFYSFVRRKRNENRHPSVWQFLTSCHFTTRDN